MLGNPTTTITRASPTTDGISTDPTQISNSNPFNNGPSVYLYAFLATLVLIFLISIGVAWKGYRTRRVLRARIDEAIARGVLIPGYDPSNPNLALFPATTTLGSRLRNARAMPRPVMFEEWIVEKKGEREGGWDIKPTALDVLRPYDPTSFPTTTYPSSHANSLLNHLLDPLRQYWFVQPPEGAEADQLQGRPGRRGRGRDGLGRDGLGRDVRGGEGRTETLDRLEEEQMEKERREERREESTELLLVGVQEVVAGVFIAMPDRARPAWGVEGSRSSEGSRPRSWHQQQQQHQQRVVASGSRPISSSTTTVHASVTSHNGHTTSNNGHTTSNHGHGHGHATSNHGHGHGTSHSISTTALLEVERKELPELVLGVVVLGLKEEEGKGKEGGVNEEVVEEGKTAEGKGEAAEGVESAVVPAIPTAPMVPPDNGGSGNGREPAVPSPL